MKPWILVVDDEMSIRDSLRGWFQEEGYGVEVAASGREALDRIALQPFDVFLLDIRMAGMDGLELQREVRKSSPDAIIIIITAYATVDTAVRALKQGAYDYVTKPFDPDELQHIVDKALEFRRIERENVALKQSLAEAVQMPSLVGESPAIIRIAEMVETAASADAAVLIRGEKGTGRERVARAIHAASPRRLFSMISIDCEALPDALLESELFGQEGGAFPGIPRTRKGKIELAEGGSLFLAEVGDTPYRIQSDLVRVLDEGHLRRMGGSKRMAVDFRLMASTDQDLKLHVGERTFREDLYYKLNVFEISIPPLRDRREDIPLLVEHFLEQSAAKSGKAVLGVQTEAMALLTRYGWPGNVRELRNAVERAVVVCSGEMLGMEDFRVGVFEPETESGPEDDLTLNEVERRHIERVLDRHHWNISLSARILGIDRATLYNKIRRYDLQKPPV